MSVRVVGTAARMMDGERELWRFVRDIVRDLERK